VVREEVTYDGVKEEMSVMSVGVLNVVGIVVGGRGKEQLSEGARGMEVVHTGCHTLMGRGSLPRPLAQAVSRRLRGVRGKCCA